MVIKDKSGTTKSACFKSSGSPIPTQEKPPVFAAATPLTASSKTIVSEGETFNASAPRIKTSGSGFDFETMLPSMTTSNK